MIALGWIAAYLGFGVAVAGMFDLIGDQGEAGVDVITVVLWPLALIGFAIGFAHEMLKGRG